ncbi:hypothetical protein [Floccifex sp.]|uniref:hypothetical protein n=1 Tax=Floccifex sp. TaxID=2815810 RepID=UPI003F015DC2
MKKSWFIVILNLVCVVSCFCLLCIDSLKTKTLVNGFFFFVLLMGIFLICKFFYHKNYLKINEYSFSIGLIFILIAGFGFYKNTELALYFDQCIGVFVCFIGILSLQWSIQLKCIHNPFSFILFVFSILMIAISICVCLDAGFLKQIDLFPIWLLLICSLFDLIALLLVFISFRLYEKKTIKEQEKEDGEAELID